ncbi:MAG: type II toxin-antitoxin system VapC family toxin [Acidimicrobiales bacterium]
MSVLVVDASVIAPAVADAGADGQAFRRRLRRETLAGPDLLRIEVLSVFRKRLRAGFLTARQADVAAGQLLELPVVEFPTAPLLRRAWALRANVTSYDACYVALAEALGCPLLTADSRLAHAPGTRCRIELA